MDVSVGLLFGLGHPGNPTCELLGFQYMGAFVIRLRIESEFHTRSECSTISFRSCLTPVSTSHSAVRAVVI
jgi:hypothetical protein